MLKLASAIKTLLESAALEVGFSGESQNEGKQNHRRFYWIQQEYLKNKSRVPLNIIENFDINTHTDTAKRCLRLVLI